MPGPIKTRDLARRAQELIPGLKVLYTSGYTANAIIHDGRLDADVLLLSKPYRRDELARQVRRALGRPRPQAAKPAAPPAAPASVSIAGPAAGGNPRGWPPGSVALVVEDDPLIRMSLLQMLESLDLTAEGVGTAEEALLRLRQDPLPALLITDLGLPGMDGIALIAEARRLYPALPVLLATGHAANTVQMPDDLRRSIGFLGKPFGMAQLEQAMAALWRSSARPDQGITRAG
jgi:CheY-like chemotaxis protein